MMRRLISLLLFAIWCLGNAKAAQEFRTKSGQAVKGKLQYVVDKMVYISREGGAMYKIPLDRMAPTSASTVRAWIKGQGGTERYTSWVKVVESEFSKPWPRSVFAPVNLGITSVTAESKKGHHVSESNHYKFISDSKVDTRVVRHFAVLFETTHKFVLSLPLNASAKYIEEGEKHHVYLFGDYANYIRAGGSIGSEGVYNPNTKAVLVPLEALGVVRMGKKFVIKKDRSNMVLAHELVHQLTAGPNFAPWYLEGSAEYVAATKYTHGTFHAAGGKSRFINYVKDKDGLDDGSGWRLGTRIKMMPLEKFMNLSYRQFTGGEVSKNYAIGMLLTYYFYHVDGRGNGAAIKQYVKSLQKGVREKEARKVLLGTRSYKELQDDFERFCHSGGFAIEFQ